MTINEVIRKIDRYLQKDSVGPLLVDAQSKADIEAIVTHYQLPGNTFISASDSGLCNPDEFPLIDRLLERLASENKAFFVREISSFYMLKGEKELSQELKELLSMNILGHAVIITFQCEPYLRLLIKNDRRLEGKICILNGESCSRPKLVFTIDEINLNGNKVVVKGIDNLAKAIEN